MRCRRIRRAAARRIRRAAAGLVIGLVPLLTAALLGGCGQQISGPVMVLRLASPDDARAATTFMQVQHFAQQVDSRTDGTIRIDVVLDADRGAAGWDQLVARGVAAGTWDLGLVPGRAWDVLGVDSLRALSAPFLVDTPAALEAVLDSDVRDDLLAGLPAAGVVGLDIFPDGMRHPFGYEKPLLDAGDYAGATIRSSRSASGTAFFQALGASVTDDPPGGDQRGAESQFSISPAGIATGNVTFFAKTDVLVAGADVRQRLRPDQWDVLRDAAAATRSWMFAQQPSDFEAAAAFCGQGGRIVAATPAQIAGIRTIGDRVVEQMRQDAGTRSLIDRVRALTAGLPAPTPVTSCPGGVPAAGSTARTVDPAESLLDGTYTSEVTVAALRKAGVTNPTDVRENTGRITWVLQGGTWTYHQRADHYISRPDDSGKYTYQDGLFTFYWSGDPTEPSVWTRMQARVSRDGTIRFTDIVDSNPTQQSLSAGYFGAPWVRIGGVPGQP